MTMILENHLELLQDGLQKIFERQLKQQKDYRRELFNVMKTDQYIYQTIGMGEMGLMQKWKDAGRQVPYVDVDKGFPKNFQQEKYALGFQVEKDLLKFDRYNEIAKKPRKLARAVHNTFQYHAVGVFGKGFTAEMLGPDGKPLFDTAHPVAPGSSVTYSNKITAKLSADALETARNEALENWTDDRGNLLLPNFDLLIVPPSLRKAALVIADSDGEPETGDNNINIWKGAIDVMEIPLLAKWSKTAWFLVDRERMKDYLLWLEAQTPTLERGEEDFNTGVIPFKTEGWWTYGWEDASFVIGSTGTGA